MFMILFVLKLSLAPQGYAGVHFGNGGDVLKCLGEENDTYYKMLDSYEAQDLRGIRRHFGPTTDDAFELVQHYLNRLEELDADRAQFYQNWADTFLQNTHMPPYAYLRDVDDSANAVFPINCEMKQAAIQKEPRYPEDKRYTVDGHLWEQMGVRTQAVLVLHEIVMREFIERGRIDSRDVRYYVGWLVSERLGEMDGTEYAEILQRVGLPRIEIQGSYEFVHGTVIREGEQIVYGVLNSPAPLSLPQNQVQGVVFAVGPIHFHSNGHVQSATLTTRSYYGTEDQEVLIPLGPGRVHWQASGRLTEIYYEASRLPADEPFITVSFDSGDFGPLKIRPSNVLFYPNGMPQEVELFESTQLLVQGRMVYFQAKVLGLWPHKGVRYGILDQEVDLQSVSGQRQTLRPGRRIGFTSSGLFDDR